VPSDSTRRHRCRSGRARQGQPSNVVDTFNFTLLYWPYNLYTPRAALHLSSLVVLLACIVFCSAFTRYPLPRCFPSTSQPLSRSPRIQRPRDYVFSYDFPDGAGHGDKHRLQHPGAVSRVLQGKRKFPLRSTYMRAPLTPKLHRRPSPSTSRPFSNSPYSASSPARPTSSGRPSSKTPSPPTSPHPPPRPSARRRRRRRTANRSWTARRS
jgi:hypothetical protein